MIPMYDELIERLRECATEVNCTGCDCNNSLIKQAADAIEELQKITTHYEEESKGWWLAACDAKEERERLKEQIPKWIPVTEQLPEKDGKYLTVHTLNTIPPKPWIEVCWFAKNLKKVDKYDFPKKKSGFYQSDSEYGFYEVSGITHWMPLPQSPESEGTK